MTGLFMLMLAIVWLVLAVLISRSVGRAFKHRSASTITALATFALLLPLPVADELIGIQQFEALCREGAVLTIDAQRIKGRSIRLVVDPKLKRVPGTLIQIRYSRYSYRDASTNEELATYNLYNASGGWLVHALAFEHDAPLLTKSGCSFPGEGQLARTYQFSLIN
jgi:hypothetical protein